MPHPYSFPLTSPPALVTLSRAPALLFYVAGLLNVLASLTVRVSKPSVSGPSTAVLSLPATNEHGTSFDLNFGSVCGLAGSMLSASLAHSYSRGAVVSAIRLTAGTVNVNMLHTTGLTRGLAIAIRNVISHVKRYLPLLRSLEKVLRKE